MKKLITQILFVLIISAILFSENITTIQISGNNKTDNISILNFIKHPIGVPFQENIAHDDILQLKNLGIFDSVLVEKKDSIYHITIKEKKTFSYSPLFKKVNGLGWSVGSNLHINNIKGSLGSATLVLSIGAINSKSFIYNKQKLSIEYINNQMESIESNYSRTESNIFLKYTFEGINNLFIKVGSKKNKLDYYTTNDLLKFDYFNTSINFSKKLDGHFLKTYYSFNYSLKDSHPNYSKFFINYNKNIEINNNNISSNIILRTQIILNTCPKDCWIDFENLYLGGDNFVRGYYPDPMENPIEIARALKFKNMLFQSIQLEIPFTMNQYFNTKLLFFNDFAIGSNNYKNFHTSNKIKGFGFGISIITMYQMRFDICIGLNHYGKHQIHFMKNINF